MPLEKVADYKDILQNLIDNPTKADIEEGLINNAKKQLSRITGNT